MFKDFIDVIGYYVRKFELWKHRKENKYWWVGLHCTACGRNVFKHSRDYFVLKDRVWDQVVAPGYISRGDVLCRKCTERALGRKLTKSDFKHPELYED